MVAPLLLWLGCMLDSHLRGSKGQRGQAAAWKEGRLVSIVARSEMTTDDARRVNDNDIRATLVLTTSNHIDQAQNLNRQTRFFQTFALCRACRVFTGINKAGRETPHPPARLIHTPYQQYPIFVFNHYASSYFGVSKIDPTTGRAGWALLTE